MDTIWQLLRSHYGFQYTAGHFLDYTDITLEAGERPEDLYQRLMTFVEDNLLTAVGSITHHGDRPDEDEDLTPSLETMVVLTWLRLLHKDLHRLIQQQYGTELRSRTLASIKPEISPRLCVQTPSSHHNVDQLRDLKGVVHSIIFRVAS